MGLQCSSYRVTTEEYQNEVAKLTEITIGEFLSLPESSGRQSRFQWNSKKRKRESLQPHDIIKISSSATPMQAFDMLGSNNIRAAPVYDPTNDEFIGVLDVRDIVKYAVAQNEFFQDANIDYKNLVPTRGSKVYALEDLEYDGDDIVLKGTEGWVQEVDGDEIIVAFDHHPGAYPVEISEIHIVSLFEPLKDGSGRGMEIKVDQGITVKKLALMRRFVCHEYDDSLAMVMNDLANGHHMIGVKDRSGKLCRIMGQSEIFSYLMKQSSKMNLPLEQYVNNTKYFGSPVQSLEAKMTAVEAFNVISKSGFSSTLITDGDIPVGVLSALDVREWLKKQKTRELDICKITSGEFVKSVDVNRGVVTCTLNQSCASLFKLIKKNNLHRIFIKDKDDTIMGCLSMTDFFKFALAVSSQRNSVHNNHRLKLKERLWSQRETMEHEHVDNLREKNRLRVNRVDSAFGLSGLGNKGQSPVPGSGSSPVLHGSMADRMMMMNLAHDSTTVTDSSLTEHLSESQRIMLEEEAMLQDEVQLTHDASYTSV